MIGKTFFIKKYWIPVLVGLLFWSPIMVAESQSAGTVRPVVRVALGMDPAEVVKQSSYPLDFSPAGQPFLDPAFRYGNVVITADVDLEILKPNHVVIEAVHFLNIMNQFDDVENFGASTKLLTLDESLALAKKWTSLISHSGWIKSDSKNAFLYSTVSKRKFTDLKELREAFLAPGMNKVDGLTIGIWASKDKSQEITVGLEHKREDGGPRYLSTPDPLDPVNERSYLLSIGVWYSDAVREYRSSHMMERRKEALSRKGLTDKNVL